MLWQSLEFPQGNTGSMFGYADAVSALKPWGCVGQRKPKYLFYVLGYVRGHLLLYSCVLDKDLDNHACNFSSPVDYLICTDVLLNIGNFLKHTSQIYDYLKSNPPPPGSLNSPLQGIPSTSLLLFLKNSNQEENKIVCIINY